MQFKLLSSFKTFIDCVNHMRPLRGRLVGGFYFLPTCNPSGVGWRNLFFYQYATPLGLVRWCCESFYQHATPPGLVGEIYFSTDMRPLWGWFGGIVRPSTNMRPFRGRYCTRCHAPFQWCQFEK